LALAGFIVAGANLSMRPQMLAYALIAMCLWAVTSRREHPGRLWFLPIASIVLANVHGAFPIVVVLGGLAAVEDLRDHGPWQRTAVITVLAGLVTLIGPFGADVWGYVLSVTSDPEIRDAVTEWAPLDATDFAGAITAASSIAIAAWLARRKGSVPRRDLLWLGLFFAPCLVTQRASVWWALVFPVVIAGLLRPPGAEAKTVPRERPTGMDRVIPRVIVGSLVLLVIAFLPWWRSAPEEQYMLQAPPGITDALTQLPDGTRTLSNQEWASWFEFAVPDLPYFVDTRIEIFPSSVWRAYGHVAFAGADWAEALTEWDVEAIVGDVDWDLLPRLREDPRWRVAYEDAEGVLFVRT
jgi:hypothetical protein